jgi:hypothetical protein
MMRQTQVNNLVAAAAAEWRPMRKHTPTNQAVIPVGKDPVSAKYFDFFVLPLKIDAVTFVSSWTLCAPLPGYSRIPESGDLLGTNTYSVGFCGIASVRLKRTDATVNLAGRNITIRVSEEHYSSAPFETIVGLYTLPFPALGDTLTYPRIAVGSFAGDWPTAAGADASNRWRKMDADKAFSVGRPVLVELMYNSETVDKKSCTFKTTVSPSGPGPASLACN